MRFLELQSVCLEGDFQGALKDLKWFSWWSVGNLKTTNLVLKDFIVLELFNDDISDEWLSAIKVCDFSVLFICLFVVPVGFSYLCI